MKFEKKHLQKVKTMVWNNREILFKVGIMTVGFLVFNEMQCYADGMPWESRFEKIRDSLTGPVAKAIGVMAMVAASLALASGEGGSFTRRMIQIVFGLTIAFNATTFFLSFFGG